MISIAIVGSMESVTAVARGVARRVPARVIVVGRSPGESAAIREELGGRAAAGRDLAAVEGADVVVLDAGIVGGAEAGQAAAACVARRSPEAIAVLHGRGADAAARSFLRHSRLADSKVIAATGHAVQRRAAAALASRLGVSARQISLLVAGSDPGGHRVLSRYAVVNGIPAGLLAGSGAEGLPAFLSGGVNAPGDVSPLAHAAAAVSIIESIANDRRRVLCCGHAIPARQGLPSSFLTLPAIVGRHGVEPFEIALTLEERSALQRAAVEI